MEYRLVRSRRRTLSIHVAGDAVVEVRAPLRLPLHCVEEFLARQENWVAPRLEEAQRNAAARERFCPGELLLLGQEYPVVYTAQRAPGFDGTHFFLPPGGWDAARPHAVAMYRTLAQTELAARIAHFGTVLNTAPVGFRVTGAARRWGSCSGKNRLCFSWRLVLAHPDALDYVVVHELAHLLHHDHSRAFWNTVAQVLPDYSRRQALLHLLQTRLEHERWE